MLTWVGNGTIGGRLGLSRLALSLGLRDRRVLGIEARPYQTWVIDGNGIPRLKIDREQAYRR